MKLKNSITIGLGLWCFSLLSCKSPQNVKEADLKEKEIIVERYKDSTVFRKFKRRSDKGDGLLTEYYPNGKTKLTVKLKSWKWNGQSKQFFSSGKVQFMQNYRDNIKEGIGFYFYENGNIHKMERYFNGLKNGKYVEYYEQDSGKIKFIVDYKLIRGRTYDNGYVKLSQRGDTVSSSPLIDMDKMDETGIVVTLRNPVFKGMKIIIGDFDRQFYLIDSSKVDTFVANGNFKIFVPKLSLRDSITRGFVENFKVEERKKNGNYTILSRDIYFEIKK